MKNKSFEDGWETLPPTGNAGYLQNQGPSHWELTILAPGEVLWDSNDAATGEPECVHKLASQLPPEERPGGDDPLILDGETVYKVFHSGAAFGVQLRQVIGGLVPGSSAKATVKVRVHDHEGTDPYGVEFRMITGGKGRWWHKAPGQLENFKWVSRDHTRTVGDDGKLELVIQVKSKYKIPVDFFFDAFEFEGEFDDGTEPPPDPPDPPPDDVIDELWEAIAKLEKTQHEQGLWLANHESRLADLEQGQPPTPPQLVTIPTRALCVDVSAHQRNFDWDAAKTGGVKYAILRSSNGLGSATTINGIDTELMRNAAECTRLGIPFSIYHFLQPAMVTTQAELVESILVKLRDAGIEPRGGKLENGRILPPLWCDVEMMEIEPQNIEYFCEYMNAGVYSSKYYWDSIMAGQDVWWADFPAWMAQYGSNSGQIPPAGAVPLVPYGFKQVDLWQFTSKGGPLMSPAWPYGLDVNLAGPFETMPTPIEILNIRPYFEPTGDIGPYKVLAWLDGSRTQPQQLLKRDGFVIEAKGEGEWDDNNRRYDHYERYQFANSNMNRWEDTSPGNLEAYTQHGARWLPEVCELMTEYVNQPRVTKYSLIDCRLISDQVTTDYLTVAARLRSWQSPANSNIVIDDVIKLEWRKSSDGKIEEVYYYGKGFGLVGWGVGTLTAAISELPEGRAPLNPNLWNCG
jgi:hypothetical protein